MEEVIESTFSLLAPHQDGGSAPAGAERTLEPVHLLALLDVKAAWFKKWTVCLVSFPPPVVFIPSSPAHIVSSRLHLCPSLSSARLLQQDGGSQAPGEEIQISGEGFTR